MNIEGAGRRQRQQVIAALAALVLAGIVLRWWGIGLRSSFDESATWAFARMSWPDFWTLMWRFEGNGVAYYLSSRAWLVFGDSLEAMRSLPLLFGVATIPMLYLLGARLFGRRVGLLAAAIMALHPFHIRFSQEARGYTMASLLVVTSIWLFTMMLRTRSVAVAVSYVLVSGLACYAHVLCVLLLGAQWAWLLVAHGWRAVISRWGVLLGLAAACLPMVWYMVAQDAGQIDWVPPLNRRRFTMQLTSFMGDRWSLWLFGALCLGAVAFALRDRDRESRRNVGLLVACVLLPWALIVAVSPMKNLFVDRYILFTLPAVLLLAAVGIDGFLKLRPPLQLAGAGLAALVAVVSLHATERQYRVTRDTEDSIRTASDYVFEHRQPGEGVVLFTAATYFPYVHYAWLRDPAVDVASDVVFPDFATPEFGGVASGFQPNPTPEGVRAAVASRDRLWVLLNRATIRLVRGAADAEPVIRQVIEEDFALTDQREFGFMQVLRYERRAP